MVKWISRDASDVVFQVRVLAEALEEEALECYHRDYSGYGLVVKRVLAKDQSGVRFSLSAHMNHGLYGWACEDCTDSGNGMSYTKSVRVAFGHAIVTLHSPYIVHPD